MSDRMQRMGDVLTRDPAQIVRRPQGLPPASEEIICIPNRNGPPLFLTPDELHAAGYIRGPDEHGEMRWVCALHFRNGIPYYPPARSLPIVKKVESYRAMEADYQRYRKEQKKEQDAPYRQERSHFRGFDND